MTVWTNAIALQAGVRYDLAWNISIAAAAQAHLYWYSPSQPRQIIPSTPLYPTQPMASLRAPSPAR